VSSSRLPLDQRGRAIEDGEGKACAQSYLADGDVSLGLGLVTEALLSLWPRESDERLVLERGVERPFMALGRRINVRL
jgi:hypothetical protein